MGIIYRGYDADALEAQYNARMSIPEHPEIFKRWTELSAVARAKAKHAKFDLRFGPNPKETLDFFAATGTKPPLQILIHGGYWRALDKSDFSHFAQELVKAGASVAVVNYDLCPSVTIGEIMDEVRRAAAWLWRNAADLGFDRGRIQVAGHSAGGQLAAALLATDWPEFGGDLPADLIKTGVLSSGLYELEPLRHTSMQNDIRLTAEQAKVWSPILMSPPVGAAVAISWGALETDEFRRQGEALAASWKKAGVTVTTETIPNRHHLNVIEEIGIPGGRLLAQSVDLMGLSVSLEEGQW
jgi:arylformamidase